MRDPTIDQIEKGSGGEDDNETGRQTKNMK